MNVLSLFDGMSCGQLALNRASIAYDTYYASEIDKHAITVTQANYPETVQLGDVENVRMKKEHLSVITGALRVEPVFINSALVSAQNRQRFYWANWFFTVPEDRGVILSDIVQEIFQHERSFMKDKSNTIRVGGRNSPPGSRQSWDDVYDHTDREKSYAIDANYWKGGDLNQYFNKSRRQVIFQRPRGTNKGGVRALDGKTPAMTSSRWEQNNFVSDDLQEIGYRKLTPTECERLQTVPDGYTDHVSNTQRYRMLGNGWTVDVIAHILSFCGHHDLMWQPLQKGRVQCPTL